MELKINVVLAATELAQQAIVDEVLRGSPSEIGLDIDSILYEENGEFYKPFWQDKFSTLYDYYFEVISNCSTEIDKNLI